MEIFSKKFKLKAKQITNDIGLDTIDWVQTFIRIVISMFWAYLVIGFCKAFFMWIDYLTGIKSDFTAISWAMGILVFLLRFPLSRIKRVNLSYEEYEELKRKKNGK